MYLFCFYVPTDFLEAVKQAVFAAGAGTIGNYSDCCWQIEGQGQFKPQIGSQPFIGKAPDAVEAQLETVSEWRVEMVVEPDKLRAVLIAFLQAHPYEEPAYHVLPVFNAKALLNVI